MRIFVTGATGFIGKALVAELCGAGHETVCLVRPSSDARAIVSAGASLTAGDLADRASLIEPMKNCDVAINVAAAYDFWLADRRAYREVNVAGTANLLEAALAAGVPKLVHVSTVAVFGNAPWPVSETSAYGARRANEYAETKLEGERCAWRAHRDRGLPLVVAYPAAVLGPDDPKPSGRLISNLIRRRVPARVFPRSPFPFVDVRDVATGLRLMAEKDGNIGERYLLSGVTMSFGELFDLICHVARVPAPRLAMPGWLAMANAFLLTALSRVTRRPPWLDMSVDQMRIMKLGCVVDASKSERELGMAYRPIRQTVVDAVASIRGWRPTELEDAPQQPAHI